MAGTANYETKEVFTICKRDEEVTTKDDVDKEAVRFQSSGQIQGSGDTSLSDDDIAGFTYNDKMDMKRMGKKQELMRNFRTVSSIAFTTCVMGTWEILLTANTQGLIAGGSAGLFWSLVWAYTGQAFVILSLAEMASIAPTAGGQYHWVSEFAPRQYQQILSYASGWLSTLAWQSIVAVDSFLIAEVILGMITINSSTFVPQRWQATLLIIATVLGLAAFNFFAGKKLAVAENLFVALHLLAFLPVIVTLLVMTPEKQTARAVFTQFTDNGAGWSSIGLTVMVGQVSCIFVVLGSDSAAHMSEEISDAGLVVPRSMVWSFFLNIPMTFGLLITYLFCIGNISDAIASPTGYPFIYVFQNSTGSVAGATGLTFVVLILLIVITISSYASTSRQLFAFARDNGMPFSRWLSSVHPNWQVPGNSILVTCMFTILMSLINIGSTVAFNAVLSLSVVALMATYAISIGCILLRRIQGEPFPPARWSLGRAGTPVNTVALIYISWAFFWSFWPNGFEPTVQTFNWAVVLFVGVMGIACLVYYLHARKYYEGPVAKVEHRS